MYSVYVTTPPSVEPVSVESLQTFLRLNTSTENTLLAQFITSARMLFESETNRALITQTCTQYIEGFPRHEIYLMRGIVQDIVSFTYYDQNGDVQTAENYNADLLTGQMGRIWFPNGIPTVSTTIRPVVTIEFTAGYGDEASDVPADICQAIMLLAGHWFANRAAYSTPELESLPKGWEAITSKYQIGNLYQWNMDNNRQGRYGYNQFNWGFGVQDWWGW